jgi:type IV secretion system protein VirB9
MTRLLLGAALALALAAPAHALERTVPSRRDSRLVGAVYRADDVIPIQTTMGTPVVIRLAPDEKVAHVGYNDHQKRLGAQGIGNLVQIEAVRVAGDPPDFLLPPEPIYVYALKDGHTRLYVFELHINKPDGDPDYVITMRYPHDAWLKRQAERRAAERRREQERTRELLRRQSDPSAYTGGAGARNYRYVAQGDRRLAPLWAYDTGFSTYLIFPAMQRVPSIYRIDPGGAEATSDYSVHGDTVMLPGTAPEWRLRDGKTVLNIWDLAYDIYGATPQTGTASPQVRRVLKSGD